MNKGKISISRPHGHNCDYIQIRVKDVNSLVPFVDVQIKYADFTRALTGQGEIDCEFETRWLDLLGTIRENKTEVVLIPARKTRNERSVNRQIIRNAIAAHEVNGWRGDDDDAKNFHRYVRDDKESGGKYFNISFVRYVEPISDDAN